MAEEDLELVITVVVGADDEQQARVACAGLVDRIGGRVVQAGDCSDEEPGCWSVTICAPSAERVSENVAGALARSVRAFVRLLGDGVPMPRVACEPPTAWTVLDDPDALEVLVPGAERMLVESWVGGDPDRRPSEEVPDEPAEVESPSQTWVRLTLRVDVAAERRAGAEWQARAVASRVSNGGSITRVVAHDPLLSVHLDLGSSVNSPTTALHTAVSQLGLSDWSEMEETGDSATIRWSATPTPESGIVALEMTASVASTTEWTEPG
ncbi:hypothetical protein ACFFQW_46945 [Umezawaea endophytica]|uniref:Uncharacterized protein n=1 Tax=Umezawaea endophytica TaxID=1654476 RepID=A0A9X2VLW5_9PSEU|nr:hypothetical protein [Umezawaea endophytica]MCS7479005.1 hypothetical protein [Umezawaea endophytica]